MDTATATIIAALAGLLGVAIGGLLSSRSQRSAQLREPMLEVAIALSDALRVASAAIADEPREVSAQEREAMQRAHGLSNRALLIFGPDSRAGEQAIEAYFDTLTALDHSESPVDNDERMSPKDDVALLIWQTDQQKAEYLAEQSIDQFSRLAGRAIRTGGRNHLLDRIRALRERIFASPGKRQVMSALRETSASLSAAYEDLRRSEREFRATLDAAEAEGFEFPRDLPDDAGPKDRH